ncbi:MAG: laccase domain-containing protein, partial [Vicinamibacterales bacterium]
MMSIPDPQPNDAFTWTQEPWGRALRCTHLPAPHLFTSRDLTLRDDEREWRGAAGSLGVARERLLLVKQVHGRAVMIARRGATLGWGRPEADAIITDDPDVAIGV